MSDDSKKVNRGVIDSINTLFKNGILNNVEFPNYAVNTSNENTENI